ncbi:FG-GAP-like repeat-containing protein [Hymenobacter sp. ASUV-10]|uniref:FG-GAP-like repeat-containing protein n=1 Tax=Hymenobacter aranciens TaxID=3063996 RepID=A0ABT9B6U6_9BACT|nr:FG-GAP-like repeat-containing protein [Hymenobacter sp. ASUV-10]MDO7873368.1 FG-GAP-like repeat-containing protein [Hymenobacter sp. ASUV-10]
MKTLLLSLSAIGALILEGQAQVPYVDTVVPAAQTVAVSRRAPVVVNFSHPMSSTPATLGAVRVFSSEQGGRLGGSASLSGRTVRFVPTRAFRPGEVLQLSVSAQAQSAAGVAMTWGLAQHFRAAAVGGTGVFGGGSEVPLASAVASVVLGDVDNDGDLDLLTTTQDQAVKVRLNDGRANFAGGSDYTTFPPTPNGRMDLGLGDVDNDGDLDLLVTNYDAQLVHVRLNNGQGSFGAGSDIAADGNPYALTLLDANADGYLDLVVATANSTSNAVVWLGNGTGAFAPLANPNRFDIGAPLTVADVDNDGDLDVLYYASGVIRRRLNDGFGHLQASTVVDAAGAPRHLQLADLNGDGFPDLVSGDSNNDRLLVAMNNGQGAFGSPTTYSVPDFTSGIGVADVDGDADLDLVVSSDASSVATTYLNNGGGGFTRGSATATGRVPMLLVTGDLDGDGDIDFVTGNLNGQSVSVRLNGGTGAPLAAAAGPSPTAALQAFPNPAHGLALVQLPAAATATPATLTLLDALGRPVRTETAALATYATAHPLDLTGLAPGLYLVRLAANGTTATQRLVVE